MSRIKFIIICIFCTTFSFSQQLMINEVSQGIGTSEYVEFVVIGSPICEGSPIPTIDLRRIIIDDNNGHFKTGSGTGIAAGAIRFAPIAFWSAIPQGTYIVIYNEADKNSSLPLVDDLSITDGNCTLIIPSNSNLLQSVVSLPLIPSAVVPSTLYYLNDSDWDISIGWSSIAMANDNDSFQIPNLGVNGTPLHSVSWGNNNDLGNAIIFFAGSAAAKVMSFKNTTSDNPDIQANWVSEPVSATSQTPGAANSLENDLWIGTMNPNCRVNPALNFVITNADCSASNGQIALNIPVSPNLSVLWEGGQNTLVISNLAPDVYAVTVTDALTGCTFVDSAEVLQNSSGLAVNLNITDESCSNLCDGDVQFTIVGGQTPYDTTWFQNNIQITEPTNFCAGQYEIKVADANGCEVTENVQISTLNVISYTISNDTTICSSDSIQLSVLGVSNVSWSTGETTNTIKIGPLVSTVYTLVLTENTCVVNESISVIVKNCNFAIDFPNIFTPNSDSINEFYVPIKFSGVTNKEFIIFNRWGEKMYESTNQIIKWDGKSQSGKDASEGVYFYKLIYNELNGEDKILQGFLHLERK